MDKPKVVPIEDRIPKLKMQRKQKANRRMIFYLSLFFLLILTIVYFQSDLSRVHKITVSGNVSVSDEEIRRASKITEDTNFLNVSEKEVRTNVKKIDEIASVHLHKKFFNHLVIDVTEYEKVAYLKREGRYYPILQNGAFLSPLAKDKLPVNAPIIDEWEDASLLKKMAAELKKLPESMIHRISEIHLTPTDDKKDQITLYMTDGYIVRTTVSGFAKKMKAYPSVVEKLGPGKKGIINMDVSTYFDEFPKKGAQGDESKR